MLRAIDVEARDRGIRCLYGSVDPTQGHVPYLVQTSGHRSVEIPLTFERSPGPFTIEP